MRGEVLDIESDVEAVAFAIEARFGVFADPPVGLSCIGIEVARCVVNTAHDLQFIAHAILVVVVEAVACAVDEFRIGVGARTVVERRRRIEVAGLCIGASGHVG